jgi:hypothetical protein
MTTYRDITPESHRCSEAMMCPGVLRSGDGKTFIFIGRWMQLAELDGTPFEGRVGQEEAAIEMEAMDALRRHGHAGLTKCRT